MNTISTYAISVLAALLWAVQANANADGNLPQTSEHGSAVKDCKYYRYQRAVKEDILNDFAIGKRRANQEFAALKTNIKKKNVKEAKLRNQLKTETDTSKKKALKKEIRKTSTSLRGDERRAKKFIKKVNAFEKLEAETKNELKALKVKRRALKCR